MTPDVIVPSPLRGGLGWGSASTKVARDAPGLRPIPISLQSARSPHPSPPHEGERAGSALAPPTPRRIVIAAGGTGGHFFPAEALAAELIDRGHAITLLTDARSSALASAIFQSQTTHTLEGAGLAGRGLLRGAHALLALARGTRHARRILRRLDPAIVVGFGGYPSIAPVLAARSLRHHAPILLHEQNAVLGRANRLLARFATAVALGFQHTRRAPRSATVTGNPVRPAVQALAGCPYLPPEPGGPIDLLVTGGSLGARVFSDAVPAAVALLDPALRARLRIVQQCRAEDLDRVRAAYAALGIPAVLSTFFPDLAERIAAAHLVVARAGASTVAELAAIGRPAILVPLPGAIDDHQAANAAAIDATVLDQAEFTTRPQVLAEALCHALSDPDLLAMQAHAVAEHGRPHAAAALADTVEHLIRTHIS